MKSMILVASMTCALSASAWHVSTEQTMQSALIEEFTGIHCPNCPDGHRVATAIRNLHPEEVFVVNLHASSFAKPNAGQPDFRTPLSEYLNQYFGVTFYPGAMINRVPNTSDELVQGRSSWGPSARNASLQPSPVNLWSEASYDAATRTVTLSVEGYLTDDVSDLRLNAWLLQNEILGPQLGGQLGEEYPHRHMLRDRLNDNDLGDAVTSTKKGEYFSRTFTYVLPNDINGVAVDPANIELLTFVSEGTHNVRKCSECRPAGNGSDATFGASASLPPLTIAKNYGFKYLEVYLNNHGGTPLTTAEFDVTLGSDRQSVVWQGCVPPYTNQLIRVPLGDTWSACYITDDSDEPATFKSSLKLLTVNGREVDVPAMKSTFGTLFTYPNQMVIKIKTDLDAAENTYRILDQDGNVVQEFGPYANGNATEYEASIHLKSNEVYCLEVMDTWGDGVRHPLGYVKLYDTEGNLVTQIKEINGYGIRNFFYATGSVDPNPTSAAMTDADDSQAEYFTLSGTPAKADSAKTKGVYICRKGDKVEKIIIR